MADEGRPRKPAKRARTLRYTSTPDWDPGRLEGLLRIEDGASEIGWVTGLLDDEDDDGGVGNRETRNPLLPLDSGSISVPLPADGHGDDAAIG